MEVVEGNKNMDMKIKINDKYKNKNNCSYDFSEIMKGITTVVDDGYFITQPEFIDWSFPTPSLTGIDPFGIGYDSAWKHLDPTVDAQIENVIFQEPATIVFWKDGEKTVSKQRQGDEYDREVGLMLCIAKKYATKSDIRRMVEKYSVEE